MNNTFRTSQLAEALGHTLIDRKLRVATAESCTGGGVAQAITAIDGSSQWFELGLVTYSNSMKERLLGVSPALLEAHGAVSEAVVASMVVGAIKASDADIAVAISGIAGPTGAVEGKPVGTVCIAWGSRDCIATSTEHFNGDRAQVREQSVISALEHLISILQNKNTV
ncbi:CinA family protein [Teredinibacter haidensis]|uniref:CinA family protein n=1 Tax=Teredinibacter haidensis TaxID=2731755 RepID=UPI000948FEB0|nr:CinA family protein [Teredinibacter haidensis]